MGATRENSQRGRYFKATSQLCGEMVVCASQGFLLLFFRLRW